ncbi:MAG TPA: dockerin type I domain-containing protein, partial [Chthoniobacterales bacterium]
KSQGSINNVKWFYSGPFSIRPDARYPDAPPTVTLLSPKSGDAYPAGGDIPISWTASDDEALRSFTILYSTDGGRTWLTMVENLPPTATSYTWQTPPGGGFSDVRVRVVAFDLRFQSSSDGDDRSFARTAGLPAPTAIVSRKLHNNVPYDVGLPIGGRGVESRGGQFQQVVFTFPTPVNVGNVTLQGAGFVAGYTPNGSVIAVDLNDVADVQNITVTLRNVSNGSPNTDISVQIGMLRGDTNGDGAVNAGDALQTRNRAGQSLDSATCRSDVNLDGVINSGDATVVRTRSGATLP